jgi:calcineurin-like phosphoesterase family protein
MSKNQVYVIGDTHFGHRNIIDFEKGSRSFPTIEEHDEKIVSNWNSIVKKNDTVIHLGDVVFGTKSFSILSRLNGVKKLVLGNHDRYPTVKYMEHFTRLAGCYEYHDCILTHMPVHPQQLEKRYRLNIHSHLHSKKLDDPRYICVSCEQTDLKPVLLSQLFLPKECSGCKGKGKFEYYIPEDVEGSFVSREKICIYCKGKGVI